jgi:hypothetical protein
MGINQPAARWGTRWRGSPSRRVLWLLLCFVPVIGFSSCDALRPLDTTPLDRAGMSYDAIKQLKGLHVNAAEVADVAKVRNAGLSDNDCVAFVRMYHQRNRPFDAGDAIAGLYESGVAESTVLGLVNLDQVGLGSGELQAIHLAGLPDEVLLDIARDRAAGKSTLSGEALGKMKNLRIDNRTMLELVRRSTPESDGIPIIEARRAGMTDAEILRHFPSRPSE